MTKRPWRFSRRDRSISSDAKSSSLKPPAARNAAASQKRNAPAAHRAIRLRAFQAATQNRSRGVAAAIAIVQPPPTYRPDSIAASTSSKSSGPGEQSASTKSSQSPEAARAPALRALAIWFIGSNTTQAPAARASSAVRSFELLSQTISSLDQPRRSNSSIPFPSPPKVPPIRRSSLNAGTTSESFKSRPDGIGLCPRVPVLDPDFPFYDGRR